MLCKALNAFKGAHIPSSGIDYITLYPFPNKASLEAELEITHFQLIISCNNDLCYLTDVQRRNECVVDFDSLLLSRRMDSASMQFLLQELALSLSTQRKSETLQRPIETASHDSRMVLLERIRNEPSISPHSNTFKFVVPQYKNKYVPMVPESKEFPTSRCIVGYVPYKEEMRIIFSDETFKSIFCQTGAGQVNKLLV